MIGDFFVIKPTDALISKIYFCQETLHVLGSSSAHHQEFSTVHSAMVYVMSHERKKICDLYVLCCTDLPSAWPITAFHPQSRALTVIWKEGNTVHSSQWNKLYHL